MREQRLFEVGDKVCSHLWKGEEGTIIRLRNDVRYPFLAGTERHSFTFTSDGKCNVTDSEPTLRHAATGSPCVVGEPPERLEYPYYKKLNYSNVDNGMIVKVKSQTDALEIVYAPSLSIWSKGEFLTGGMYSREDLWTICEKPAWKFTAHIRYQRRLMMIELTREEAIDIIKSMSRIEGFLFSIKDSGEIMMNADYVVDLLANKLTVCERHE